MLPVFQLKKKSESREVENLDPLPLAILCKYNQKVGKYHLIYQGFTCSIYKSKIFRLKICLISLTHDTKLYYLMNTCILKVETKELSFLNM